MTQEHVDGRRDAAVKAQEVPAETHSTEPVRAPGRPAERSRLLGSDSLTKQWPFMLLIALIILFSITSTGFSTKINLTSTTVYASSLIPIAVGQLLVVLTGGIDLSMAGTAAFTGMCAGLILQHLGWSPGSDWGALVAVLSCLIIGVVIGAVNGMLIAFFRLAPFIVTLGTLEALSGAVNLVNNGNSLNINAEPLRTFGSTVWFGWLTPMFLTSILIMLLFGFILSRTRFGMRTYSIGSNPEGVRRLGVPTRAVITSQYAIAGALGGVAGFFLISRINVATTVVDTSGELTAIAAVVIGGASLAGGRGTMFGTFTGVGIVSVLLPGLVLSGLSSYWQAFVTGIIIVLAVAVEHARGRVAAGEWRVMPFAGGVSARLRSRR